MPLAQEGLDGWHAVERGVERGVRAGRVGADVHQVLARRVGGEQSSRIRRAAAPWGASTSFGIRRERLARTSTAGKWPACASSRLSTRWPSRSPRGLGHRVVLALAVHEHGQQTGDARAPTRPMRSRSLGVIAKKLGKPRVVGLAGGEADLTRCVREAGDRIDDEEHVLAGPEVLGDGRGDVGPPRGARVANDPRWPRRGPRDRHRARADGLLGEVADLAATLSDEARDDDVGVGAEVICPSSVDLPTPAPAKMPTRWPRPTRVQTVDRAHTGRDRLVDGARGRAGAPPVGSNAVLAAGRSAAGRRGEFEKPSRTRPRRSSETWSPNPRPRAWTACPGLRPTRSPWGIRSVRSPLKPMTSASIESPSPRSTRQTATHGCGDADGLDEHPGDDVDAPAVDGLAAMLDDVAAAAPFQGAPSDEVLQELVHGSPRARRPARERAGPAASRRAPSHGRRRCPAAAPSPRGRPRRRASRRPRGGRGRRSGRASRPTRRGSPGRSARGRSSRR